MANFLANFAENNQTTLNWWSLYIDRQVANKYQTKEIVLLKYYHITKTLINNFECFEIYYIPRESNTRANLLSKLPSTKKIGHLKTIIQETL
ncbi:hypothetical protein JHK82_012310 [Glycine max]|uniref:RNase H type-1 domain-containing protein n=1 Tax=Glycine max TaxID=3847 RepID=A0A0R0JY55_SOYBN|nr:hypothetical protein JHK87_012216 [Glycine soja]KAG5040189.1 hypothetical protein JHK85_012665 [Glycine max]KAG5057327.1 hypothetical protein JHK86_012323 [Glycine max]KAG5154341.1 hypothetical protein JHK82_012310 [Glycine max]KAH1133514.1 hypothetical protein GYH30_012066 [Glycine max]